MGFSSDSLWGWGEEIDKGQRRVRDRSSRCSVVRSGHDGENFGWSAAACTEYWSAMYFREVGDPEVSTLLC